MAHVCRCMPSIVIRLRGSTVSILRRKANNQLSSAGLPPGSFNTVSSPCVELDILVHGSYCNSSPVKYALYSGLFSDGSSQGVSESVALQVQTYCPPVMYTARHPFPRCRRAQRHILIQVDLRAELSICQGPNGSGLRKTHFGGHVWQASTSTAQ
jgi:hypothetical protein